MASHLEIDDVIDPAETRDWLIRVLATARRAPCRRCSAACATRCGSPPSNRFRLFSAWKKFAFTAPTDVPRAVAISWCDRSWYTRRISVARCLRGSLATAEKLVRRWDGKADAIGLGVAKDIVAALRWHEAAAARGLDAKKLRLAAVPPDAEIGPASRAALNRIRPATRNAPMSAVTCTTTYRPTSSPWPKAKVVLPIR